MTIPRTNPSGWGPGLNLTSAQANGLDTSPTFALDKRSGQTDTFQCVATCSGPGRLIPSFFAGPDTNTSLVMSGGISLILATTLTANRTYQFSASGAQAGDIVTIVNASTFQILVQDQSAATINTLIPGFVTWSQYFYTGSAWVLWTNGLVPTVPAPTVMTASGTYTPPAGYTVFHLAGAGAGGGGGAGAGGTIATAVFGGGGAGGGGASSNAVIYETSHTSISVTIGTGGPGGTGGTATTGADGTDGTDTAFDGSINFSGGKGGKGGTFSSTSVIAQGGLPAKGGLGISAPFADTGVVLAMGPSAGGDGVSANILGRSGSKSLNGGLGGSSGSPGSSSSTFQGGGPGGGGGGGGGLAPGQGGSGGAGGNANSGGAGTSGSAGGSASANTGAGGGGGGAAGGSSAGTPSGGSGGTGGSGYLVITPIR